MRAAARIVDREDLDVDTSRLSAFDRPTHCSFVIRLCDELEGGPGAPSGTLGSVRLSIPRRRAGCGI
jgi:hypothetical protein